MVGRMWCIEQLTSWWPGSRERRPGIMGAFFLSSSYSIYRIELVYRIELPTFRASIPPLVIFVIICIDISRGVLY
jgi:hypothetical protein